MDRGVTVPGPLIGAGRAADIYDVGGGRVLRRYRTPHDSTIEAEAMRAVFAAGYPVPEVFDADGRDLVMERVDGPTMLDRLGHRPWTYRRMADQLAELHTMLAALPIGATDLAVRMEPAECLVHLDLHPGNIVLTARGPRVIDWSNAGIGPRGADVATTWMLVTIGETDDVPLAVRPVVALLRRRFVGRFLEGVPRPTRDVIHEIGLRRLVDRNLRDGELTRLREFVDRFAPAPP